MQHWDNFTVTGMLFIGFNEQGNEKVDFYHYEHLISAGTSNEIPVDLQSLVDDYMMGRSDDNPILAEQGSY